MNLNLAMSFSNSFHQSSKLSVVLLLFFVARCDAVERITANRSLSGDETMVSPGGMFELGFFDPSNSSNFYIGIWYKNIPKRTVIWVANRDKPVSDKHSAVLRILNDGNLAIVNDGSSLPIWSTELENISLSEPVEAVLLDDGNLVLRRGSDQDSNPPIWESFDNPTDTFMAGAKLGFNKVTKKNKILTSWKNTEDPATGLYSLEHDRNASQYVMLWNQTDLYWKSGLWVPDQRIFSQLPEFRLLKTQLYNFSYVDNENETYIVYFVKSPSIVTRLVVDVSGQLKQLIWMENTQQWLLFWTQPGQQCQVHAYCGAFGMCNMGSLPYCRCFQGFEPKSTHHWSLNDYSGGCVRKGGLSCDYKDEFLANPGVTFPENPKSISVSSREECEMACLANCSCTAYSYDDASGCSTWVGDLLNVNQVSDGDANGRTLYIRVAASSEVQRPGHKVLVVGVLVGLGMGLLMLLGLVSLVYFRQRRRLLKATKAMHLSLTRFEYRDLQYATRNFSEKLGGGGFGSVFKGSLPDSTVIAVKKLESLAESQGEKQFRAEVSAIGTIQHVNLVQLRGFCSQGDKRLLVYEYMPNGSLEAHLFRRNSSTILSWKIRHQVALGIARGLMYLHEKCRDCIIHCDIKPENILLDTEFCPKIADFGLAKLMGREFSRVLTTIRGTRGYLAPEWISGVAITAKADVYSYGMVLFELVSGRRNTQQSKEGKVEFFPTRAMINIVRGEDVLSILDPRLEGNADRDEVVRMCKLACWCVQDEEDQRPTMGQAVQVLEGFLEVDLTLLPRSLRMFADDDEVSFISPSEFLLSFDSTTVTSPYDSMTSSVPYTTTSSSVTQGTSSVSQSTFSN